MLKRETKGRKVNFPNWSVVAGLTGGLGSGKSTVLSFFKNKKVFCLDADKTVHDILKTNRHVLRKIRTEFGKEVFNSDGSLNRRNLAKIIFRTTRKRKKLENLLHPKVEAQFRLKLKKRKGKLAICDVPLLFEKGWNSYFDKTIVVWTSPENCEKRLLKRGFSLADIRTRMRAQWSLNRKVNQADFVIDNDESKSKTKKQVHLYGKKLLTE
ncbi:dephospho-CoA kinase [bacterium F11]|nr:dephospho-CoA kinase [bacterium F11]